MIIKNLIYNMSKKSNKYLLIMGIISFILPILFTPFYTGTNLLRQNYIDVIILGGFNHLLRAIIFFIILEPISLLWKKFVRKKELHPFSSKEFWEDEIESLFVSWLISTLLFLPGDPIWVLLN
jgi:hypothetical protein